MSSHTPPVDNPRIGLTFQDAGVLLEQGKTLHRQGQLAQANAIYQHILAQHPRSFEALHLSGVIAAQSQNHALAVALIGQALELNPTHAPAHSNMGLALQALGRLDDALASHDRALALKPDYPEACSNRGNVLLAMGRTEDALASHDQALALKPDYPEACNNRGNVLLALSRTQEALASYDRALALDPGYAEAWYNRGNALQELRRMEEAVASYDRAMALNPAHADAHWNKSQALLSSGNYQEGWALFEWRWKNIKMGLAERGFAQPQWLGAENLAGKTILLHSEQGLGDVIQFARYAKWVKAHGARVLLEVPPSLLTLFERLPGVDGLIASGQPLPAFDCHCPLMSLPLAFGTTLANIPDAAGYLTADPGKVQVWRERLGPKTRLRVGVVWNGGNRPHQMELQSVNERRNVDLQLFASALRDIGVDFYSLQKGDPAESQIHGHELDFWPDGNFHNHAHALNDFSDTAALIENLDLVVSVDTSTAHLAAALGKPTWVLNRYDACWRWLMNRDDSPWYAAVKLYQQDDSRRWQPVLDRLARDLRLRSTLACSPAPQAPGLP